MRSQGSWEGGWDGLLCQPASPAPVTHQSLLTGYIMRGQSTALKNLILDKNGMSHICLGTVAVATIRMYTLYVTHPPAHAPTHLTHPTAHPHSHWHPPPNPPTDPPIYPPTTHTATSWPSHRSHQPTHPLTHPFTHSPTHPHTPTLPPHKPLRMVYSMQTSLPSIFAGCTPRSHA